MDAFIAKIHSLATSADEAGRKKIIEQLRDLSFSFEEPADVVQRIQHRHLEIAMVRIGIDLGIFNMIVEKEGEVGLQELGLRTGAGKCGKEEALFVDMGGNIGHQCADFKAKYPEPKGRVVLQDLQYAIDIALKTDGVDNSVHDIFTRQTVKGAKFYYLRAVLHDWPDAKCQEILRNIIPATADDSAILIDEMVLPETKAHWEATQIDLSMMASVAARERTRGEWETLLWSVGLVVEQVWTYTPSVYESVMLVKRK